jgi:hypothetical protein
MKRSFSIVLLSTLIIVSSIEAFIPPAAIAAANLVLARRFALSVVAGDFLINLGRLSKEPNDPALTLQDKTRAVFSWMHDDFFDACKGVNYIAETTFIAAEEISKRVQQEKQNSSAEKPTDPENIKEEVQKELVKEVKND